MSNNTSPTEPISFTFSVVTSDLTAFPRNQAQFGQATPLQSSLSALSTLVVFITQVTYFMAMDGVFGRGGFRHLTSSHFFIIYVWMLPFLVLVWIGTKIWNYFDMKKRLSNLGEGGNIRLFTADHEGFELIGNKFAHKYHWRNIKSIDQNSKLIIFPRKVNPLESIAPEMEPIIPKEALGDRKAVSEFVARLKAWHSDHQSQASANLSPSILPDEQAGSFAFQKQDDQAKEAKAVIKKKKTQRNLLFNQAFLITIYLAMIIGDLFHSGMFHHISVTNLALLAVVGVGGITVLVLVFCASNWKHVYDITANQSLINLGFGPTQLAISCDGGTAVYPWSAVKSIKLQDGDLVIGFTDKGHGLAIPDWAFGSDHERSAVMKILQTCRQGKTPDPVPSSQPISWPPPPTILGLSTTPIKVAE